MNKPQIKRKVSIKYASKETGMIEFYATPDAAAEFAEFGKLVSSETHSSSYILYPDGRFDFAEVVKYIESYRGTE